MNKLMLWMGYIAGAGGALLSVTAGAARLLDIYWLGGFQLGTLLLMGIAAMTLGCWCFLAVLVQRSRIS
ncbi:MAG: hypothetical protein V4443_07250 [Pseudomonadota bacterium]